MPKVLSSTGPRAVWGNHASSDEESNTQTDGKQVSILEPLWPQLLCPCKLEMGRRS